MVTPYFASIGGAAGVFSRITGSLPRELTSAEKTRLQATLDAGGSIEIVCESQAAWEAMRGNLFAQLGIGA